MFRIFYSSKEYILNKELIDTSMNIEKIKRETICDNRGFFLKVMNGYENYLPKYFGEIYIIQCNKLETRAGHYHQIAIEWFTPIQGSGELILIDIVSKEKEKILIDCNNPYSIRIDPNIAHLIKCNEKSNLILHAYSSIKYNPSDTFSYKF